jgi:hypothetical protein
MAIAALAFVLFVEPEAASAPMVDEQLMPLLRKKEILYENLRDLLFEFRMGKLSEADYTESKRSAQAELVPLMSALDELNAKKMREEVNNAFCGNCGAPLKKKKR